MCSYKINTAILPRQRAHLRSLGYFSVLLLGVGLMSSGVIAQTPRGYAVNARIDENGHVEAAMHAWVDTEATTRQLRIWLYPDRLSVAPSAMDELSSRWVYPRQIDLGGITIQSVELDGAEVEPRFERAGVGERSGRDFLGADMIIPVSGDPGRRSLRIRFTLDLPRRFGRLGRVRDRITMAAPWYPLILDEQGAYRHDVPHRVHVTHTGGAHLLIGSELREREGEVTAEGAFVPVVVLPRVHVRTRRIQGVEVRYIFPRAPYDPPSRDAQGLERLEDVVRIDTVSRMSDVVSHALTTTRQAGVPVDLDRIDVVTVPLRTELTATAPGLVLVSDRIYEIFPVAAVRDFHDRAIRRAVFRHFLGPLSTEFDPPADRDWADDLRAVVLSDLDAVRRDHAERTPEELVGWAGFHPAVDQLLYAPQISFADVFFASVDEPDSFRDDPARARWPYARGRRILESSRDALQESSFREFIHDLIQPSGSARAALRELDPAAEARLDTWIQIPALEVNYRLGEIRSEALPDGRHRHLVEVIRDGAHRPERVEVQVTDEAGERVREVWMGEEWRGVVELITNAPFESAQIDPRGRLTQSPEVADGHPRRDDMTELPWRPPILRGFNLAVNFTEGTFSGFVDFGLRRKYDLENAVVFFVSHGERATGGTLRYVRGVGPKVDNNARSGSLSGGFSLSRLRPFSFVNEMGEDEQQPGGYRFALSAGGGYSTVRYHLDPRTGHSIGASISGGMTRRDDGSVGFNFSAGWRGHLTFPVGLRNAFILAGGFNWTYGAALASERPAIGGPSILRGYESGELIGDGRLFAVVEHRWTAISDLSWNILHIAWLREIQLAFFAGAGTVFNATDGRSVAPAAEVGGGIRFHYDYGGIQPGMLSIDVGVPLVRTEAEQARRSPIGLHVGFDQYF